MCGHSSKTADTYAKIMEFKHGQLSNEEAIKMLSDKCEYMSTVMIQMSTKIERFVEKSSDPHVDLINSHAGNANEEVVGHGKDDDGVKTINTEHSVSTFNNGVYSLLTKDSHNSMGNGNTYAKVPARGPSIKSIQHSKLPNKGVIIKGVIMINDAEIANKDPVLQKLIQQDNLV